MAAGRNGVEAGDAIRVSPAAPAVLCNAHSRAFGPSIDPGLNDRAELLLASRRWLAPGAGTPTPRYQFVLATCSCSKARSRPPLRAGSLTSSTRRSTPL